MTDRVKGLVVALKKDLREDDVMAIQKAIAMIVNVADVQLIKTDISDQIAEMKVRQDLIDKLWNVLR